MASIAASSEHPSAFQRWKNVVFGTLKSYFTDPDTSPRCAAAAFFGFLSFFPAIATVALIYGIIADRTLVAETIDSVRYLIPDLALDIAAEQLTLLATQPPTALGLGLLISVPLTLWSSSRGVDALLFAMSRVRRER